MAPLTLDQVDREICRFTTELAALSTALVELDTHAGIEHVRRYPPTGITAERWAAVEAALTQMWDGLRWMTSILDAVQALRARSTTPSETGLGELARLLRERPLAVSPEGTSLDWPSMAGPGAERVGLTDTADRIRAAYPAVADFLAGVEDIGNRVAKGLAPHIKCLDELGETVPVSITDLLAISATDPLGLTPRDIEVRLGAIARAVELIAMERAEVVALQSNWPAAVAVTADQLDALCDALQQAAHARAHAGRAVATTPLPVPTDPGPDLRDRLRALADPDPSALRSLRADISTRDSACPRERGLGQGPARPPQRTQRTTAGVPGEGGTARARWRTRT